MYNLLIDPAQRPQRLSSASTVWADGLGPAPVEPDTSTAPEQAPEAEGGGGAELAALQGIDAGVDQAGIDQ